jgi:hypothetical protein
MKAIHAFRNRASRSLSFDFGILIEVIILIAKAYSRDELKHRLVYVPL